MSEAWVSIHVTVEPSLYEQCRRLKEDHRIATDSDLVNRALRFFADHLTVQTPRFET